MARATVFSIRFAASIVLMALVVLGILYLNGMSNGKDLSEPNHLSLFTQHILADTYVGQYINYEPNAAYRLIETETVRKIVQPFADAMTYAVALVAVGSALWLVYAWFVAKPRQPSEVAGQRVAWTGLLLLTLAAAVTPAFALLRPAVSMIQPLVQMLTLALVGGVAALLYVAWTYLLTPSLLRPALPMAWRLGR